MKKLSLVFAMLLMFVLCIGVGAAELDLFKEPVLNATYSSLVETEFTTSDEFVAALEELSGEEIDIDGEGMVDAYTFLGSLFDILGYSTIKIFYVSRKRRREGIGSTLLSLCEGKLKSLNIQEILFGADYDNFFPGIPCDFDNLTQGFLEKRGYDCATTRRDPTVPKIRRPA